MKMVGNCDATNGAGLSNAPTPGWDSSADCSSVMNICSPPTGLSSISPASGSRCGNVYETRSSLLLRPTFPLCLCDFLSAGGTHLVAFEDWGSGGRVFSSITGEQGTSLFEPRNF